VTTSHWDGFPTISAYVYYEDAGAAMDWLIETFGFTERMRGVQPDGSLGHCELSHGNSVLMIGGPPGHQSPARTGHVPFGLYVLVDDVDAHFDRVKAAGAQVQDTPTDQSYGVRSYGVLDLEGNQWWFAQPLAG
jgi:uncharacterized glyoxalase superfamily protein PhnB